MTPTVSRPEGAEGGAIRADTFETDDGSAGWASDPLPHKQAHAGYFEWRDEWSLEVGFMDEDHRALAAMMSRIARDYGPPAAASAHLIRQSDAPPLTDALAELAAHVRAHFDREEEVMRVDNFPGLWDHQNEHNLLLAELSVTTRELRDSRAQWLSLELLDGLKDWFLGHVLDMDRELAEFLKNPRSASLA
jgi:hemerythrin